MSKVAGRLALRVEGEFWNAYYARPDTLVGAILIGSIRMNAVPTTALKDRFLSVMKDAVSHVVVEAGGANPTWEETPVRAHERSGNA